MPIFVLKSSKKVTNPRCSSSSDESILTCFMNLKKEGFTPKKGLSSFDIMSPMKVNSVSFMFRESKRRHKETPKGHFLLDIVPKAQKSIK